MKILVGVKRVIDAAVHVQVNAARTAIVTEGVKMAMNPFDEIAVEEAVQLKESGIASDVVVATVGPKECQETLRADKLTSFHRGAGVSELRGGPRVILLTLLRPHTCQIFRGLISREADVDLVLLGKQAIDSDGRSTGPMLAGLLGWPQGTWAMDLTIPSPYADTHNRPQMEQAGVEGFDPARTVCVVQEAERGSRTMSLCLPAVVTCGLQLCKPRLAKLQNIMKARRMGLDVFTPDELGVDLQAVPKMTVLSVEPSVRQRDKPCVFVKDMDELVDVLYDKEQVLP